MATPDSTTGSRTAEDRDGSLALSEETVDERSMTTEREPVRRAVPQKVVNETHETHVLPAKRDRVRWGPVWAGALTALATFLLLELAFLALDLLTLGGPDDNSIALMTGLAGLIAFLLGGLTAAATAQHRGFSDGLLHGILVWVLAVIGITLLTLLGGGALFGAFSSSLEQISGVQQAANQGADVSDAVEQARDTASKALAGLGAFLGASALGGLLGAKFYPSMDDAQERVVDVK